MLTIAQGDCFDLVRTLKDKVDLVMLDPDFETWHKPTFRLDALLRPLERGYVLTFSRQPTTSQLYVWLLAEGLEFRDELIWYDPQPIWVSKQKALKVHENILVFRRGDKEQNSFVGDEQATTTEKKGKSQIGRWTTGQERIYTKQPRKQITSVIRASRNLSGGMGRWGKPPALIRTLIECYSNAGDIVFDPFMGQGAFGRVGLELGRGYVGYEIDSDNYTAARERLGHDRVQGSQSSVR